MAKDEALTSTLNEMDLLARYAALDRDEVLDRIFPDVDEGEEYEQMRTRVEVLFREVSTMSGRYKSGWVRSLFKSGRPAITNYFPIPRSTDDKSEIDTLTLCGACFRPSEVESRDGPFRLHLSVVMIRRDCREHSSGATTPFAFRLESGDDHQSNPHSYTHVQLSDSAKGFYGMAPKDDPALSLGTVIPGGLAAAFPTVPIRSESGRDVWLGLVTSMYKVCAEDSESSEPFESIADRFQERKGAMLSMLADCREKFRPGSNPGATP